MCESRSTVVLLLLASLSPLRADGPRDNNAKNVRRVPPLGIELATQERAELQRQLDELTEQMDKPRIIDAWTSRAHSDVAVFHRAVDVALRHREFFTARDVDMGRELLAVGRERVSHYVRSEAPWQQQTGLVPLGYISRIDGSVQPYGLVVPPSYRPDGERRYRLDIWFHGRGETLSEVKFLYQRMKSIGQIAPQDTFVLHPYGRYCNAFKFAGEVDVLEALADVQERYRIDPDRIAVRGFSMGGAGCWQFAVHYADRWFAAGPGAGFAETPEFLKFFQKEILTPTPWERRLWHLYDCTDSALNLFHCPTVAYSGELDIQKQAADIMAKAMESEGIELVHVIGPKTRHRIHPESKVEVEKRLASLAERGRERMPRNVRLTTYTLKYDRTHWVTVDALGEHWKRAKVEAELLGADAVRVRTENVTGLTLSMPPGWCPLDVTRRPRLEIDGQMLEAPKALSDRSWSCRLHSSGERWRLGAVSTGAVRKRHDLQGPIDDGFMDSFVFVSPTGSAAHAAVERWTRSELDHAVEHWRRQFRGDAIVREDKDVSEHDVTHSNLVLFGDPASNAITRRIAAELPIAWNEKSITVRDRQFDAAHHALILIYPNPLNPRRYVVLNSGFTYREYDYLNNARQVPKLPDWAVVDLRTPASSRYPGRIIAADFFDELWRLK